MTQRRDPRVEPGPNVRRGVQSVHRALDILEFVARSDIAGATAVAEAFTLPVSTAHGIMRTLADRHYLLRVPGGYRMGPAAAILGSTWGAVRVLSPVVGPIIERLSEATALAATATVLVGREAQLFAATEGPGTVGVRVTRDDWRDPLTLATGRLLISYAPEQTWQGFLSGPAAAVWSSQRWGQEFSRIRAQSIAVKLTTDARDAVSMAVPVLAAGNVIACAIGCFCPAVFAGDLFNENVLGRLWHAAKEASEALGGSAPRRADVNFHSLTASLPRSVLSPS